MWTLFLCVKAMLMKTMTADVHHISFIIFAKDANSSLKLKAEFF